MATNAATIRVFVVDDHAVVRHGLSTFLGGETDLEVVGDAEGGETALELLQQLDAEGMRPHVVLMDLEMEPLDGIELTKRVRALYDDVQVMVLTSFGDGERVQRALAAGAAGYLLKDADVDQIADAVRGARQGELRLDAGVAREFVSSLRTAAPRERIGELTPREWEVIRLIGEGDANKTIASKLGISERTARTHVSNILAKLGLSSRTQAALWAAREGVAERR